MLKVSELETGYGESQVLFGVSLEVEKGEVVSIVGANANGKTTLLKTISGIQDAWKGEINFIGKDITEVPYYERVKRGLIQCPEGRKLFSGLSVVENLKLGAYSKETERVGDKLKMIYDLFPVLSERENQQAGTLSGGERQMCAIGRAIMGDPKLLLLDEPSLGLAPKLVQQVFEMIEKIHNRGVTILLVEQNVDKALSLAQRGYVLEDGQVTLEGTGEELLQDETLKERYLGV